MSKENEMKQRIDYGSRRLDGFSPTFSEEVYTAETLPTEHDMVLEVGSSDSIVVTIGDAKDAYDLPSRIIGEISHTDSVTHAGRVRSASVRGTVSKTAGAIFTSAVGTSFNTTGNSSSAEETISGVSPAQNGITMNGMHACTHAFPLDIEVGALGHHDGQIYSDLVFDMTFEKPIASPTGLGGESRDALDKKSIDLTGDLTSTGAADSEELRTLEFKVENGKSAPHFRITGISPNTGLAHRSFGTIQSKFTVNEAGDGFTTTLRKPVLNSYDPTLHSGLARSSINTPEEYVMRNMPALRDIVTRAHSFIANDVMGSWQKGGRSGWWTRGDPNTPTVIGELAHTGMCLRLKEPILNCHAVSLSETIGGGNTIGPTQLFRTGRDTTGVTEPSSEETPPEPPTESSDGTEGAVTPVPEAASTSADMVFQGVNASVGPFHVYLPDCDDADDSTKHEAHTNRGLFMGNAELANHISPGLIHKLSGMPEDRDPVTGDVFHGLAWILSNTGGNFGQQIASISPWFMEFFEDYKAGKLKDLYAYSARLDADAIRVADQLGFGGDGDSNNSIVDLSSSAPSVDSGPGYRATQKNFFGRFFGDGFILVNEINQFTSDIDDMSQRTYRVGNRFNIGQSRCGDSKSSTMHSYTRAGSATSIDVSLRLSGAGHFGIAVAPRSCVYTEEMATYDATGTLVPFGINDNDATRLTQLNRLFQASSWIGIHQDALSANKLFIAAVIAKAQEYFVGVSERYFVKGMPVGWIPDWNSRLTGRNYFEGGVSYAVNQAGANPDGRTLRVVLGRSSTTNDAPMITKLHTHTLPYEYFELGPRNELCTNMAWFDEFFRLCEGVDTLAPFKTPIEGVSFNSVSVLAELSNRTGNPALQASLKGLMLVVQSSTSPSAVANIESPFVLDRKLYDREIHKLRSYREEVVLDMVYTVLPSEVAGDFLQNIAAARILLHELDLLGELPFSTAYAYHGGRTIYQADTEFNGTLTLLAASNLFNYEDNSVSASGLTDWPTISPGYYHMRRIVPGYGTTNRALMAYGGNSVTSSGSRISGLSGFRTNKTVHGIFNSTLAPSYFKKNDGTAVVPKQLRLEDFELFAAQVQGSGFRELYNATDLMFVGFDQDLLSREHTTIAGIDFRRDGSLMLGPSTLIIKLSKSFEISSSSAGTVAETSVAVPQAASPVSTDTEETYTARKEDD